MSKTFAALVDAAPAPSIAGQPKISLNMLGEYLQADASRRRKIVFDQKYPKTFISGRYREGRSYIGEYMASGCNEAVINDGIATLRAKTFTNEYLEGDRDLSIELMDAVLEMDLPDLSTCTVTRYTGNNPKLMISDVAVSVNPDIVITKGSLVGCLKFHSAKTNPLTREALLNVATVLHQYADEVLKGDGDNAELKLCISADVFANTYECAPKSFVRRKSKIVDACEEIAIWWDRL